MLKKTARALAITVGGFVFATVAVVGMPGAASAEETHGTVSGDCAATLTGAADHNGDPLTVDAGAPLGQDGLLDVGLGSAAKGTGDAGATLVSLPVADTIDQLGASDIPAVAATATDGCETVQRTVNTLGATTRRLLPAAVAADSGLGSPEPAPSDADPDDAGTDDADNAPGVTDAEEGFVTGTSEDRGDVSLVTAAPVAAAPSASEPLSFLQVPAMPPAPEAPDLNPDRDGPRPGDRHTGRIDALPASDQANSKIPFILAVALLAVVGAVVVRRLNLRPKG